MAKINYKNEQDFLNHYNPNDFERPSVTVDIAVFSISDVQNDNYRKLSKKQLNVLLVKRDTYPFKDKWCLPGGFIGMDEPLEESAKRILKTETNISNLFLEQLAAFGDPNRDPRMRVISVAYMSLIRQMAAKLDKNATWFTIEEQDHDDSKHLSFSSEKEKFAIDLKKSSNGKYEIQDSDKLAFDHNSVIVTGLQRLRDQIKITDLAFNLVPEFFTLGELQQIYEIILGKKLLSMQFRRMVQDRIQKTDQMSQNGGHRPAALYRLKKEQSNEN